MVNSLKLRRRIVAEKMGPGETFKKICPNCGKRIAGGRRGTALTSYMFGESDCSCPLAEAERQASPLTPGGQAYDSDFCPKCGLKLAANPGDTSVAGFRFQTTQCQCPPDQTFADGQMTAKFWKLKQAGSGTIFTSSANEVSRGAGNSINLAPGATIGGLYRIIELIGRGGMGEVYLAEHGTLGKKCALKVIPPDDVTEIGWMRFQLEARAVAKLDHINLVRVTDLGIHEGCLPFYAMDYVEGQNLADWLAEKGPMSLRRVLRVFVQVCDGLECAHRSGILHRDLKPANIMWVTNNAGVRQAKILDFGLAKLTKHDRAKQSLTAVGDVFGSPFYMSPEQCKGETLDNRSDIYSLGCTMFECLTGQPPFVGHLAAAIVACHLEAAPPTLASVVGQGKFPPSMEAIISKLLSKNPADRHQTLSELKSDLMSVAEGEAIPPGYFSGDKKTEPPKTEDLATAKPGAKQPKVLLLALSSLVLVVLVLAVSISVSIYSRSTNSNKLDHRRLAAASGQAHLGEPQLSDGWGISANPTSSENAPSRTSIPSCRTEKSADGLSYLVFTFPQNLPLGTFIDIRLPGGHTVATGEVRWPVGWLPVFQPSAAFLQNPDNLDVFQPDHLGGLDLRHGQPDQKDSKLMHHIGGLTQLRFLNLEDSDIGDGDLQEIAKLRLLEGLSVSRTGITGAGLAKLPQLRQLQSISFSDCQGASDLLAALSNNGKLLELDLQQDHLTSADYRAISTLTNLRFLHINDCGMTSADLVSLTPLSKLRTLGASDYQFTTEAIKPLKILRKKGLDFVNFARAGLSAHDVQMITEIIPRAQFKNSPNINPPNAVNIEWTGPSK